MTLLLAMLLTACVESIPRPCDVPASHDPQGMSVPEALREAGVELLPRADLSHPALSGIDLERAWLWTRDPAAARSNTSRYGEALRLGETASVVVRRVSEQIGFGLFAAADLPAGTFLGEYAGELVEAAPQDHFDHGWLYPVERRADGRPVRLVIDAARRGNAMRFVNHSAEPNAIALPVALDGSWRVAFVAKTDIASGEQILIHYGDAFWTERGITPERLHP